MTTHSLTHPLPIYLLGYASGDDDVVGDRGPDQLRSAHRALHDVRLRLGTPAHDHAGLLWKVM